MEFVPIALACGHLVEGAAWYSVGGGAPATCDCPSGCGPQEFVVEPGKSFGCLCEPGHHVCGDVTTVVAYLGWLDEGDALFFDSDGPR